MKRHNIVLLRGGRVQSAAALGLCIAIAIIIAMSSRGQAAIAGQLAAFGVILVACALALGSARLIGVATLPMLGAALIASAVADEPAWARSIVLGILWYVAAEVAWDGIERRDGVNRSSAFDNRRIDEVAVVVTLSLVIAGAGLLAASFAPTRTIFSVGLVIVGLLAALLFATRFIRGAADEKSATGVPETPTARRR
jgi:hypothetical protein